MKVEKMIFVKWVWKQLILIENVQCEKLLMEEELWLQIKKQFLKGQVPAVVKKKLDVTLK